MVNISKFYGEGLKQLPPIRVETIAVQAAINNIQNLCLNAVNELPAKMGWTEEEAREYCVNHGVVLLDWIKSARVIGCVSRIPFPVMIKAYDPSASGTGYTKYEGIHMGAFQIFRYDRYTGAIKKDNSDEFLRTLFTIDELKVLDKNFKTLLFSYHSNELPEWTAKDCTGKPTQNIVLGIEPEVQMNPAAIINMRGVPLNKMGRIVTMCTHLAKQDPLLTLDATVDLEFYIRPYGNLCGFRDNYLLLCKLFIVDENCGTHVHVSIVDAFKNMKWKHKNVLLKVVELLFTSYTCEVTMPNGYSKKKVIVTGFNEYLKLFPDEVEKILGRLWGYWCGCYVGDGDHGASVNVGDGQVEIRLPQIHDEKQMIKVCEIVRAIAKAIDALYDIEFKNYQAMFPNDEKKAARKKIAEQNAAFRSLVTVWNNAMENKLASDTNSTKKAGSRRRNID